MLAFRIIIGILGLVAILSGINDLWHGASVQGDFGDLGAMGKKPMLNFTLRFFSAIWTGFGALLILFATDVKRYDMALIFALVIIIIGGLGRLVSTLQFGIDETQKTVVCIILVVELCLVPALLIWYLFFLRNN